jgi:hypothetical protein
MCNKWQYLHIATNLDTELMCSDLYACNVNWYVED